MLYRRVDDAFLDPLTFSPDSALGVPGIMDVYRAGNITIANAPGTGIADDKAIYSYMPEIVEFYTGRKAILDNIPTWRCSEPDSLEIRAGASRRTGGQGSPRLRRLRHAGRPGRVQEGARGFRARSSPRGPSNYIAQPTLSLSTCPILTEEGPGAAPCRSPALRAGLRPHPDRARRPDARGAEGRFAGGEFLARAAARRTRGCWTTDRTVNEMVNSRVSEARERARHMMEFCLSGFETFPSCLRHSLFSGCYG